MAAFLNRPLAGTLMGAVAVAGAASAGAAAPSQYYTTPPAVSLNPVNARRIQIGPDTGEYAPGPYIMRVPPGVRAMRGKLYGGQGTGSNNSQWAAGHGGRVRGDFVTLPSALMLVILGAARNYAGPNFREADPAYGGVVRGNGPSSAWGGGFVSISRLSQSTIDRFNILPPQDPAALLGSYEFYRDNVPAILEADGVLLLAGGSGSHAYTNPAGNSVSGAAGYPFGQTDGSDTSTIGLRAGRGGTQSAGGQPGQNMASPGFAGQKFIGGRGSVNNSPSAVGGGGWYGGGGNGSDSGANYHPGGGGSSYVHPSEVFYPEAPNFGAGTDADADRPAYYDMGSSGLHAVGRTGRLILYWDNPA